MSAEQGRARGNAIRVAQAKVIAYRRYLAACHALKVSRAPVDPALASELTAAYADALRRQQERATGQDEGADA